MKQFFASLSRQCMITLYPRPAQRAQARYLSLVCLNQGSKIGYGKIEEIIGYSAIWFCFYALFFSPTVLYVDTIFLAHTSYNTVLASSSRSVAATSGGQLHMFQAREEEATKAISGEGEAAKIFEPYNEMMRKRQQLVVSTL